jgi:tripartite-type tricarboxylate transporter receptor subunit TctC
MHRSKPRPDSRRRTFLAGGASALAAAVLDRASLSAQEAFPTRIVKLIVPSAGGSTTDTLARLMADQLSRLWPKPVVVENISGAATIVGSSQVFRAPPDGHTLLIGPPSPFAINQLLYRDLPYDPRQFVPVALLARIANVLTVRPDLPVADVKGLIAYAKANPGKLSYGSQGAGTTAHLSAAQLEALAGISMIHVPYRGAVPALNDVIAGHIDMFFDTLATSVPLYRAGKVRILAVGSAERSPVVPELPTMEEAGVPGFRSITWFAMAAPPGTRARLAEKINADVVGILRRQDTMARLAMLSLEPIPGTPADAASFFAEESRLWGKVIRDADIKIE